MKPIKGLKRYVYTSYCKACGDELHFVSPAECRKYAISHSKRFNHFVISGILIDYEDIEEGVK